MLLEMASSNTVLDQVYSAPSGKFRAHVDTPRGEGFFGSLIVCLPSNHEGRSARGASPGHQHDVQMGRERLEYSLGSFLLGRRARGSRGHKRASCDADIQSLRPPFRAASTEYALLARSCATLTPRHHRSAVRTSCVSEARYVASGRG